MPNLLDSLPAASREAARAEKSDPFLTALDERIKALLATRSAARLLYWEHHPQFPTGSILYVLGQTGHAPYADRGEAGAKAHLLWLLQDVLRDQGYGQPDPPTRRKRFAALTVRAGRQFEEEGGPGE